MRDPIERQDAIDVVKRLMGDYELSRTVQTGLYILPSAQTEQKWIPCSERLPDRFGKMLVTFIPAAGTLWTQVIIAYYSDLMGIARPCFWIGTVGKNDFANITSQVVAWMPLPEPYKEGEQE